MIGVMTLPEELSASGGMEWEAQAGWEGRSQTAFKGHVGVSQKGERRTCQEKVKSVAKHGGVKHGWVCSRGRCVLSRKEMVHSNVAERCCCNSKLRATESH